MRNKWFMVVLVVLMVGCSEDVEPTDEASIASSEVEAPSTETVPTPDEPEVEIEPTPSFTATESHPLSTLSISRVTNTPDI